jgi:hypothetical protein
LWAQQLLFHLAENGVGVMIASTSALFKTGIEAGVRQGIVEANILDAVIELPPGLLPGTSLPLVLLVLARNRKNRAGRILFVDGRQLGISRRGKPRELTNDDIQRLTSLVAGWRKGHLVDKPLFAAGATVSQLAEADYNLSPSRYVGYKSEEVTTIEGEEIGERFAHLRDRIKAGGSNVTRIVKQIQHGADAFVKDRGDQWPLARIGDLLIAAPRTGMRQESEREGLEETPYITTRLVSGGPGYIDTLPSTTTRGDVRDRLTAAGDLLLVSRGIEPSGSIRCATVRFDGTAAYSESLMRLRFDPSRVEPDYLRWYLTSRRGRSLLSAVTTGTVIANLRGEALVEVKLPLPPIDEQHRIVAAMRNVERGVEQLSKELNEANALLDTLREGIAAGMYIASSRR